MEMTGIAVRIATGYGFSSPYLPPGDIPTTVSPPLYVWLMVSVYKVLGINTYAARVFLQCLNIAFHCVTLVLLFNFCARLISLRSAKIFAVLFALHPALIYLASNVWENSLSVMWLSIILYLTVFYFKKLGIAGWFAFGLLLGVTSLSNPVWAIGYPFLCFGAFYFNENFSVRRFIVGTAVIVLGFSVVLGPWTWRNYEVTNKWMLARGMSGPEWFKGNNVESWGGHGDGYVKYFLYVSAEEREKLRVMGEVAYDKMMMDTAKAEIQAHPGRYVLLTAARIAQWWTGDIDLNIWYWKNDYSEKFVYGVFLTIIGFLTSLCALIGMWRLRAKFSSVWPLWIYVFIMPIPYYLVVIGFRYQSTLMPFLLIPAAYFIAEKYKMFSLLDDLFPSSPVISSKTQANPSRLGDEVLR
jgi:4-amino-4-deoxy-L-arabinose transferase-like glycosyltransferase